MNIRSISSSALLGAALGLSIAPSAFATDVIMRTSLGDIRIELFDDQTPITVQNFLDYINSGAFEDSMVHRSVPGFVIQGGAFYINDDGLVDEIQTAPPIQNEPGISNARGTIAMAKISGDPNSATSQWFFNLEDNAEILDDQNGGFTVFGRATDESLEVIDAIGALQRVNIGVPGLGELPVRNWSQGEELGIENFVIMDVEVASDFVINPGLNDAWFNPETAGQGFFFNVFPDQGTFFLSWFTYDAERPDANVSAILGDSGHRWITAQGSFSGNRATLSATLTRGGVFDSGSPAVENVANYGTLEVEFTDCNDAVVTYDFPDSALSGQVEVQRVVTDNVVLCEALADTEAAR